MSDSLKFTLNIFKSLTNKPEKFISVQNDRLEETKSLIKHLYDLTKKDEAENWKCASNTLPELIIDGFDEEQVWQQIELQNESIVNEVVKDVATLLSKKSKLNFYGTPKSVQSKLSDDESESDEKNQKKKVSFLNDDDDDADDSIVEKDSGPKSAFEERQDRLKNRIEDLENEALKEKPYKSVQSKLSDDESESDEKNQKKKVSFLNDDDDDADDSIVEKDSGPKSAFEERQDRLKNRIEDLENEALKEKPWHLKGEVASTGRPQNSLLEEYVEFDRAARPAPVFTEKTTLRLEDIIKQRIKDKSWDDVLRKVKPVEDVREYRKRLVLDQEKSKVSLAEIYEQEFIKQRDAAAAAAKPEATEDVEPPEHVEIKNMIKKLFYKLDALSNFHYTPKPVAPEVKIISNLPAITMEDVAPVATSDAALLAPEEVKSRPKGDLMSKEERTLTDKKRERRKKKLKQRAREQEKIKKEKLLSKMSLGLGNKYSKEKARKTLDKLTKERNVDKMVETQSKHLKSSSAFFNQLQDEVKSQIKKKTPSSDTKRKGMSKNITAKRIKL